MTNNYARKYKRGKGKAYASHLNPGMKETVFCCHSFTKYKCTEVK